MIERESTYVVTREDRSQDPVTFVAEGLSLGRLTNWEVCLNHPSVSRLHAGVSETGGRFYLYHLSPSNS
ncbi:MAG: FHA domain-containing protein, partial [Acidobacteria bacterium]|nr:FHA domain-containing protein [Acidobacteriota bacterium]